MAKRFESPVEATQAEREAESVRVNKLIRSSRGKAVTLPIKSDKTAVGMGAFLRVSTGRGTKKDLKLLADKVKVDEEFTDEDLAAVSPGLLKVIEGMTDEQLTEFLDEDEGHVPGKPKPKGNAGSGGETRFPRRGPRSVSEIIRHVVRVRKNQERGGR